MSSEGTTRLTGGQAIVEQLLRHGVDTVFGLPGAQTYGLFDALHGHADRIRVVGARHEQACGYMALGYARATGRTGVFSVVPGPGILNASAALLTALGVNAPVLAITGQVPSDYFGRGRGHLHEMRDQLATMRGFTKWADRIEHPAEAPQKVVDALAQCLGGRRGPVALEAFWDTFTAVSDVRLIAPVSPPSPPPVDTDAIDRAAALIVAARAPMIFVGGGAIEAADDILDLAKRLSAPVVSLRNGRGIVSEADVHGHNLHSAHEMWPETDLVIAIGTRLEILGWRWSGRPEGLRSIRIDIDPSEFRRHPSDVDILADAPQGVQALNAALAGRPLQVTDRQERMREAKARSFAAAEAAVQPQMSYLKVMREVMPEDGIIVDDLSQVGFTSWFGFPVYRPRTYLQSGYQGTLGSGYGTALGAKVACPDRAVLSFCGDGGFMFAVQELATAAQYGIALPVVVFNNRSFANVRRDQMQGFGGNLMLADLENPDFPRLAEAFGVRGVAVDTPEGLQRELERSLASDAPSLVEVSIPRASEGNPWPFIHPEYPAPPD